MRPSEKRVGAMRRKIIAGNWKMNGSLDFMQDFMADFKKVAAEKALLDASNLQIILSPPSVFLHKMKLLVSESNIDIAAQNVSSYESGAYTGEVSSSMLLDTGCKWCLVGHSERRTLFSETDNEIVEKVEQLLKNNIQPILCVGETLKERENGQANTVVERQVEAVFGYFDEQVLSNLVVAYEPVWAIGTGKTASPEQAQEMHKNIRSRVAEHSSSLAESLSILYGGSVNASNAQSLFVQKDIDGGLVGGASLKVDEFSLICEQVINF